mmetsp:Transcript_39309/g.122335  ORF Transcript_39309/g.122335 Transcript_39309/m.122335 type:complete len:217 (+) Transcript_39309:57-707(+)
MLLGRAHIQAIIDSASPEHWVVGGRLPEWGITRHSGHGMPPHAVLGPLHGGHNAAAPVVGPDGQHTTISLHLLDEGWLRVCGGQGPHESPAQQRRLHAHVRQDIGSGLLHGRLGPGGVHANARVVLILEHVAAAGDLVVEVVQAPGPLHGAGSEHQRPARGPVHHQVVRGRARVEAAARIHNVLDVVDGRLAQAHKAGGAEAVVNVLVPLMAKKPL